MATGTPDQIAADWAARVGQSTDKITRGIQGVTSAPGQAAARQKGAYVQNVQASADKWAANTSRVSLSEWQQAAISKGVPRVAAGAQAAQPKMAQVMAQLLPHIEASRQGLPPRGNLEQNIQRAADFARKMSTFRKR